MVLFTGPDRVFLLAGGAAGFVVVEGSEDIVLDLGSSFFLVASGLDVLIGGLSVSSLSAGWLLGKEPFMMHYTEVYQTLYIQVTAQYIVNSLGNTCRSKSQAMQHQSR